MPPLMQRMAQPRCVVQLARIHHAEITFAVHDFADERLLAEDFGGGRSVEALRR